MISIRKGTVIGGKYRLEEPLARGGMGSIWVARHIHLDVLVAVKFIDPDFASTAEGRMRFEREAKSAAMLHSPHVVQIHDYGVEFETPYIAMELLQGEDLSARLKREGRLSLEAAAKIAIHVSKALRRAHEAGIVHRDLKPSNIFIVYSDEDDELIKVLDFGVAKDLSLGTADADDGTKRGALIGSPRYMSPEQARRNREIDHRSDLWSLGVILFRAVTGQLPFPGDEIGDVIVKICSDPIPTPSEIAPDLGPDVDRFFFRAMAREPSLRFQSAREMASEFAILAGALPPASRFTWPLPGDGMRISWLPGIPTTTDYAARSLSGTSLVIAPSSSPTPHSIAGATPPATPPVISTLTPPEATPAPSTPESPESPPGLPHPLSLTSPSAAAELPAPSDPASFTRLSSAPSSSTIALPKPITVPPSTPTLLEQTKLTERGKKQDLALLAGPPSSSSDPTRLIPGKSFDDIEQAALEATESPAEATPDPPNPISSRARLTPPTRLDPFEVPADSARQSAPLSETVRKSSPSIDVIVDLAPSKSSPSLEKFARQSSPSVDKLGRKSSPSMERLRRKSSPSIDRIGRNSSPSVDRIGRPSSPSGDEIGRSSSPSFDRISRPSSPSSEDTVSRHSAPVNSASGTLTSSTGSVDIPFPRGVPKRRPVVFWVAVASAIVIVCAAMAVVRLSLQDDPSPTGASRGTPTAPFVATSARPTSTSATATVTASASAASPPRVGRDAGAAAIPPR